MSDFIHKYYYKISKKLCKSKFLVDKVSQLRFFINFWEFMIRLEMENEILHKKTPLSEKLTFIKLSKLYKNKIVLPFFDLSVCTACSLRCQKCSQWFPYLKQKQIFSAEKIINDLNNLFKYVDNVHYMAIIGGEPFLNKELDKILEHVINLCNSGKIEYVKIITNGTIYPSEKVLELLKHPQISLFISHYPLEKFNNPIFIENRNKLIKYLEENSEKILYEYLQVHEWEDYGDPINAYNKNPEELKHLFNNCRFKNCAGLYDSNLYRCPRVFSLYNIANVKPGKNEYIDLAKIKSRNKMKKAIRSFYSVKYLNACDWCLSSENRQSIEPAVQLDTSIRQ